MNTLKRRLIQTFCIAMSAIFFFSTPMQILASGKMPEPYTGKNDYQPEEQTALTEEQMAAMVDSLQEEYRVEAPEPIATEPEEAPRLFSMFSLRAKAVLEENEKETDVKIIDEDFHIYPKTQKTGRKYKVTEITVGGVVKEPAAVESIEYWLDGTGEKFQAAPLMTPLENGDNWSGIAPFKDLETGKLYQFIFEYHDNGTSEEETTETESKEETTTESEALEETTSTTEEEAPEPEEESKEENSEESSAEITESASTASAYTVVSHTVQLPYMGTVSENTITTLSVSDNNISTNNISEGSDSENHASENTISANSISANSVSANDITGNIRYSEPFCLYEVQRGDSLRNITQMFGIPAETIIKDNGIEGRQPLKGSVLFLRNPDITGIEDYEPVWTDEMLAKIPMQGEHNGTEYAYEIINLYNGALLYTDADVEIQEQESYDIARFFHSQTTEISGVFGYGISSLFDTKLIEFDEDTILYYMEDGAGEQLKHKSDGTHTDFTYDANGNILT